MPHSRDPEFGSADAALDIIMQNTGCTRRQAKAKLLELVRSGKMRTRIAPAFWKTLQPSRSLNTAETGLFMEPDSHDTKLGCCCNCRAEIGVRNVIMLPLRAPVPGTGWGCVICHLPPDGAVAVVCDACVGQEPKFACHGFPKDGGRIPLGELLSEPFDHDPLIDHDA